MNIRATSAQLQLALENDGQEHAHTLGRAPAPPPSHFSTQSTGARGGGKANESWRFQSWPDVRGATPPGGEPADRASHLGSREPATGLSIPVPCPLGPQPARQTGRAGGDRRSSLACQAAACFDDSSIQRGQKRAWFTFFNATGWIQSRSLTGHRCIPTVALRSQVIPHIYTWIYTIILLVLLYIHYTLYILALKFLFFLSCETCPYTLNIPDNHSGERLGGGDTAVGGAMQNWSKDLEKKLARDFKYPLARLIMVDRRVRAHNLVSSPDNNWEVGTECDEKIKIIIVFLLELKGFFLFFFSRLNSREKFSTKMSQFKQLREDHRERRCVTSNMHRAGVSLSKTLTSFTCKDSRWAACWHNRY